jgi:hypothetical protein
MIDKSAQFQALVNDINRLPIQVVPKQQEQTTVNIEDIFPTTIEDDHCTPEYFAQIVEECIACEVARKGGFYLLYDVDESKPLALTLVGMKGEPKQTEDSVFVQSVEMKDDASKYVIDFFIDAEEDDVIRAKVQSKDGTDRYTWTQDTDTKFYKKS